MTNQSSKKALIERVRRNTLGKVIGCVCHEVICLISISLLSPLKSWSFGLRSGLIFFLSSAYLSIFGIHAFHSKSAVMSPNQGGVYAVSGILIFASALVVGLRFRARQIKQAGIKSDDYLVLSAMVCFHPLVALARRYKAHFRVFL